MNRYHFVVLALSLALAAPAAAFDITGTWTGTRKCKFIASGEKFQSDKEGTVEITQQGNAIGFNTTIGSTHLYSGVANFGSEKPDKGEMSVAHCRNHVDTPPFDAVGRFVVKTKTDKVKATISGVSIFADEDTDNPSHGTCKWKLTRISTAPPNVDTFCGQVASRRAAKKNVTYLSDAELKRLHDDLLRYRLATYQYSRDVAPGGTHLGFIIDDVEPSPSIAAGGNRVDLYAYTSMAVAALQTQAHEIERLKQTVAALEASARSPRHRRPDSTATHGKSVAP